MLRIWKVKDHLYCWIYQPDGDHWKIFCLDECISLANAGDSRDVGLIPGLGRSPGGGYGNPLQYSCLENSMDRATWQATVNGSQSWAQLKWLSPAELVMSFGGRTFWISKGNQGVTELSKASNMKQKWTPKKWGENPKERDNAGRRRKLFLKVLFNF